MFKHIRARFSIIRGALLTGLAVACLTACAAEDETSSIPDKPYPNLADVPSAPVLQVGARQAEADFARLNADREAALAADRELRGGESPAAAAPGAAVPAASDRRPAARPAAAPAPAAAGRPARPSAPQGGSYANAERLGAVRPPAGDGSLDPADRLRLVAAADAARGRAGRVRVVPVGGSAIANRGAMGVAEALIALGVPANRVAAPAPGPAVTVEIYLDY